MEIIEIEKVMPYLINSFPIGMGMTAICFKNIDNVVIKIFKKNDEAKLLVDKDDFLDRLTNIGRISNSTFIGPDTILVHNDKVVGYLYPYINAKVLAKIPKSTRLSTLFGNYEILLKDTKEISDEHLRLYDVHNRNILFNGKYYVIDLDKSNFMENVEFNFIENMSVLFNNILWQIYGTKPWELVRFMDYNVEKFVGKMSKCDIESIKEFVKLLSDRCEEDDPTIMTVKKKIKGINEYNSYYKLY